MKNFKDIQTGLLLAIVAIFLGSVLGGVFGVNEELIKSRLSSSGMEVLESVYEGNEAKVELTVGKAWKYMIRAHLHWGVMGIGALAICILTAFVGNSPLERKLTAIGIGSGAFLYGLFWMCAGFATPALGSTGLAKAAYDWLAVPGAGCYLLATLLCMKSVMFYKSTNLNG